MKTSLCAPCCNDPFQVAPSLIAMGLAPMEAASSCNGVNPQNGSQMLGCLPGVPCCGPLALDTFLNGHIPGAIGAGTVRFSNGGPLVWPQNNAAINNLADLLAFLNTEVIPYALLQGQPVDGVGSLFSIQGPNLIAPRIGGSCAQKLLGRGQVAADPQTTAKTVLVDSAEGVIGGDTLAPASFSGSTQGAARPRRLAAVLPPGTEVIATKARALVLPPGAQMPDAASDGWMVADPLGKIERGAVPGFDRVPVKVPGDSFAVEDLGNSPRRADWEGLRDPNTGSPTGAYVGFVAGIPINGPSALMEPGRFAPGDQVVSPRIAVPIDVRVSDSFGTVRVKPGFQLLVPSIAGSILTIQGGGGIAPPASAAAPSPLPSASTVKNPAPAPR